MGCLFVCLFVLERSCILSLKFVICVGMNFQPVILRPSIVTSRVYSLEPNSGVKKKKKTMSKQSCSVLSQLMFCVGLW